MCDADWLIGLVLYDSILVKILFCKERDSRGLERNWKGRSFWEWKKLVVGHDYVHPNVENPSGPSTKEVV